MSKTFMEMKDDTLRSQIDHILNAFRRNMYDSDVEATDAIIATVIAEIEQLIPEVTELDNPLQQSWKLGGTDENSYRHGYHHAVSTVKAILTELGSV
jgi:hypothetical protein